MGSWGFGLLDNDAALGIKELWDKELKVEMRGHSKWDADKILNFFLENQFNGKFTHGDFYDNCEILALAKLLIDSGYRLPESFLNIVEMVISTEMTDDFLREWENPKRRKTILQEFLKEIDGRIKEPKEIGESYPILPFKNKNELHKKIKNWIDDIEDDEPNFLRVFDKILKSRLGYEYDKLYFEGTQQRLMLIAYYFGSLLKLPNEEILKLVEIAKNTDIIVG